MNKVIEYIIAAKDSTGDAVKSALGKVRSFASDVATNLANIKAGFDMAAGVVRNFASVFGSAIKEAFKFEKVQSDFTGLLNSVDKAKAHIADLRNFASSTPLTFDDLSKASKLLLSFGMNVDEVMPSLKMLGDIAMGDSQKFDGLALVFAQVKSAGKLMGQDLLQMINQGFNPLTVISKETGRSMSELKDIMAEGGISFEMVAEAMRVATSDGGLFNNAMSNAAQTGEGLVSTLQDKWTDVVRTFGDAFADTAKVGLQTLIDKLTELVQNGDVEKWANEIAHAMNELVDVAMECAHAMNALMNAYQKIRNISEAVGDYVGTFVGSLQSEVSVIESLTAAAEAAKNTLQNQKNSNAGADEKDDDGDGQTEDEDDGEKSLKEECLEAVEAVKESTVKHANSLADMLGNAMSKSVEKADKAIQKQLSKEVSANQKAYSDAQSALSSATSRVDELMQFYMAENPNVAYAKYLENRRAEDNAYQRMMDDQNRLLEAQNSRLDSVGFVGEDLAKEMQEALREQADAQEYARLTAERLQESVNQLEKINQQLEAGRSD